MGSVIGSIREETPKFRVLEQFSDPIQCELRQYDSKVLATYTYDPSIEDNGKAFNALARYIGVFQVPENTARSTSSETGPEKIAMTAPVLMGSTTPTTAKPEKIAMTAPVLMGTSSSQSNGNNSKVTYIGSDGKVRTEAPLGLSMEKGNKEVMAFVLPSQYTIQTAPVPTNPRVVIVEEPARKALVHSFSGYTSQQICNEKGNFLLDIMKKHQLKVHEIMKDHKKPWYTGQFNPPWTPGPLRTNEIYIWLSD
jgi:hypothetical protein